MFTITTRYTVTEKGAGRIVAKGNGKQATVVYDHEHSADWNHGEAAGTLCLKLGWTGDLDSIAHACNDGVHKFTMS